MPRPQSAKSHAEIRALKVMVVGCRVLHPHTVDAADALPNPLSVALAQVMAWETHHLA